MLESKRPRRAIHRGGPVALLLVCLATFIAPVRGDERPNILIILADDWGWEDLSCHGHPYVRTPNIDRLAHEGTDYYRFTVASGVCSPSRAALMTGHFPARYNIDGHFAWVPQNERRNMPDWLSPDVPLLPRMLRTAGYATAHFGKWHLSNDMIPDSPLPSAYGYDRYGAFNCAGEQMPVHEDARQTIEFIQQCHDQDQPFFINLWIHEPHTPFHTVPKYEWRFRDLDRPDQIYASVLSHADDRIGAVLDTLDRLELTDRTLVIFTSDNGPARAVGPTELALQYDTATGAGWGLGAARGLTGGRKGYKACLFEGGIGVPFIARWPGKIAAGAVDRTTMLSAVDLVPTLCDLANVPLPDRYEPDGVSQWQVMNGTTAPVMERSKPLFWKIQATWPARPSQPDHWATFAVVDQRWKLLCSADAAHCELYDLTVDPLEQTDLAERQPDQVGRLVELLDAWRATLPAAPSGDVFSEERQRPDTDDSDE
ncbi:MAG: sulfatase-like hydrolase/transferase [Planctomycetales bacterium]|nr:sulfatase-like hydrolase/transferase [Planctomycetales bacterium]